MLNLAPEFVPVGDSRKICVNLAWANLAQWRVTNLYKPVSGLPDCSEAYNGRGRWQKSDPKQGVDIQIWKQHTEDVSCSTSLTCRMACPGVYKGDPENGVKGQCFTYDVLKAICLEVGLTINPETFEETWEYRGGCFEKDSPTLYERGVPGVTYNFDYVPIEVRADDDPFNVAAKQGSVTDDSGLDLSFFGWVSWLAFSLALIASLVLGVSVTAVKLFL